ncbi:MAG: DivIVA domain-containing protein, partial [Acidimicrobiales bacterium]|nr:DivIVA domain-containing protein [Acidimicrobiales bacterium]
MSLTPEEIMGATFTAAKRGGYATDEVEVFLHRVAADLKAAHDRARAAESANEDLQAASNEMAALLKEVHTSLGERRRAVEAELAQRQADAQAETARLRDAIEAELGERRRVAERDAASMVSAAAEQAEASRQQAARVVAEAEAHSERIRAEGEDAIRVQCADTLRQARTELQGLLRKKHEILHALADARSQIEHLEDSLEATALSDHALSDDVVDQTLIDLRDAPVAVRAPQPAPAGPSFAPPGTADQHVAAPAPAPPPLPAPAPAPPS